MYACMYVCMYVCMRVGVYTLISLIISLHNNYLFLCLFVYLLFTLFTNVILIFIFIDVFPARKWNIHQFKALTEPSVAKCWSLPVDQTSAFSALRAIYPPVN